MTAVPVTHCGGCGSEALSLMFDMGYAPPPCVVRIEPGPVEYVYPVKLLRCRDCTLVQMGVQVDPGIVFGLDYTYSSGNSPALHDDFEDLVRHAKPWLKPGGRVLDIGANDGTLLSKFPHALQRVAVEPTGQIHKIEERDPTVRTYQAPFTLALAQEIEDGRPFDVITATNVMAHTPDIHDMLQGVQHLLADDGVFISENHHLRSIVEGLQWDTVYHEHQRFYTPHSYAGLLARHCLWPSDVQDIPTHGGSFRMFAHKLTGRVEIEDESYDWSAFRRNTQIQRAHLRSAVSVLRAAGKRVAGVGATARATAIIHYCGFSRGDIDCVVEQAGSDKIGTYMPATTIPVLDETTHLFAKHPPEIALLFSWHMADTIVPKMRKLGYWGTILVPLPNVQHIRPRSERMAAIQ